MIMVQPSMTNQSKAHASNSWMGEFNSIWKCVFVQRVRRTIKMEGENPLDVVTGMLLGFAEDMERRSTKIPFIFMS